MINLDTAPNKAVAKSAPAELKYNLSTMAVNPNEDTEL
jgi:hypothetical protein